MRGGEGGAAGQGWASQRAAAVAHQTRAGRWGLRGTSIYREGGSRDGLGKNGVDASLRTDGHQTNERRKKKKTTTTRIENKQFKYD